MIFGAVRPALSQLQHVKPQVSVPRASRCPCSSAGRQAGRQRQGSPQAQYAPLRDLYTPLLSAHLGPTAPAPTCRIICTMASCLTLVTVGPSMNFHFPGSKGGGSGISGTFRLSSNEVWKRLSYCTTWRQPPNPGQVRQSSSCGVPRGMRPHARATAGSLGPPTTIAARRCGSTSGRASSSSSHSFHYCSGPAFPPKTTPPPLTHLPHILVVHRLVDRALGVVEGVRTP